MELDQTASECSSMVVIQPWMFPLGLDPLKSRHIENGVGSHLSSWPGRWHQRHSCSSLWWCKEGSWSDWPLLRSGSLPPPPPKWSTNPSQHTFSWKSMRKWMTFPRIPCHSPPLDDWGHVPLVQWSPTPKPCAAPVERKTENEQDGLIRVAWDRWIFQ